LHTLPNTDQKNLDALTRITWQFGSDDLIELVAKD
jgi:hypothetical protein